MSHCTLTAVIHKEGDIYVANCPDVGAVSQGWSIEAAIANLKEATEHFLEVESASQDFTRAIVTTFDISLHA
jgi:predicted RNase H-like HicB family nuclease